MKASLPPKAFEFNKEACLCNWIEINGPIRSGKSILSQHIVSNFKLSNVNDYPVPYIYIFNSRIGGGLLPRKVKEMEESIYSLLEDLNAGFQYPSGILLVIEELDHFFDFATSPSLLRSAILEILANLKKWKITLVTTRQSHLDEWNRHKPIAHHSDSLRLQVTLGDRALEIARRLWGTADVRYIWLVEQDRPCIVCDSDSIRVAIVPEIKQETQPC